MAGEEARVEIHSSGDDGVFWLDVVVNGYSARCPIHIAAPDDSESVSPELERLVKAIYRRAYRDGFASCGEVIKDALGLP